MWWKWTLKQISSGVSNWLQTPDTELMLNRSAWTCIMARPGWWDTEQENGICYGRLLLLVERTVFTKKRREKKSEDSSETWYTLSCIRANTRKYIQKGQFTFQGKRRRINCLTEKLTPCISSPHEYVWTHFVLKAGDDFCSAHPNIAF